METTVTNVMDERIVKLNEIIGIKLSSISSKKRPAVKAARELAKYILDKWDDEYALSDLILFKNVDNEELEKIIKSRLQNFADAKEACEKAVKELEAPKSYKDVNGKEIKAGDFVKDLTIGLDDIVREVFSDEEEGGELAVNVDGTTIYLSEIKTDMLFEIVEAPKAEVKLTDKEQVALGFFVKASDGEGFIMEEVEKSAKEIASISLNSLKGLSSSLQKKGLLDMYNGDAYFDGAITELGWETYNSLSAKVTAEAKEKIEKKEAKKATKEPKAAKTSSHKVGDVHKNGKWVWTEYAPGKFDWRTIPSKKQKTGAKPKNFEEKKETKKVEKASKGNAKRTKKAEPKKESPEAPKLLTIDAWVALPIKTTRDNKKLSEAQKQAFKLIVKGYRITSDKKFFEKDGDRKSCNWESIKALFKRFGLDYIPEGLVK